jgi:hypothetical protein
MDLPQSELIRKESLDQFEQATPSLVPFIKRQVKLAVVRKRFRCGQNSAGGIDRQDVL